MMKTTTLSPTSCLGNSTTTCSALQTFRRFEKCFNDTPTETPLAEQLESIFVATSNIFVTYAHSWKNSCKTALSSLVYLILPKNKETPLYNAIAEKSVTFRTSLTGLSVLVALILQHSPPHVLKSKLISPDSDLTAAT